MRIIAGELKGRKLDRIDTGSIRPTSDRVREALFSILGDMVIDSSFLDLFSGSGGVGIEAYSRGAKEVVFVDVDSESIKVLKNNLKKTDIIGETEVICNDYALAIDKLSNQGRKFDIIFIDPPYKAGIALEAVRKIQAGDLLKKDGIIVIEHEAKELMPEAEGIFSMFKEKKYGNVRLSLYVAKKENGE
ncbi:16S rRNA (guanine(966)-N(2))-methyltransferase RsmD [Lutispora saccharofermentans]|uniref:16S rRNA (Guanine(966)-N(2))-methyltransferase RsmD n=1 Tax=Lutispora saccharofermentans TaxID=3024236 RepID=A0ABT1NBP0_9FIRM|nr:16S rRNA (guanine(966)-N(2))-methyltransferase RsmD [Lutispora saccharofermentans]MCQ1528049.1 16S rRNA (guanine(966)-N(2))-methyltransferase RsmD [Lutispora saccharofermentans]